MYARTIAAWGLNPLQCKICSLNGDSLPCEKNDKKICSFTMKYREDKEFPIFSGKFILMIAYFWNEIVTISRKEVVVKHENKKKITYRLPTLEKMEFFFKMVDFDLYEINEQDAFYLISLFHKEYCNTVLS